MSDRERAREIADAIDIDCGDWDGYGVQPKLENKSEVIDAIATALAQARAEGLRQAAEVVEGMSRNSVYGTEPSASVLVASRHVAARLRALAEPGK